MSMQENKCLQETLWKRPICDKRYPLETAFKT